MKKIGFSLLGLFLTLVMQKVVLAEVYLREDQEYANLSLYSEDKISIKFGSTMEAKYSRDMQDYYTKNNALRRDNYQILGKIRLKTLYEINDVSSITAYVSTNLNYKGMKQFDSALTVDKTYIVYDNKSLGSFTFGSVNGLYSEVALWSNVAGLIGGTGHVPTYAKMSLIGIDGSLNSFQYRKAVTDNVMIGAEFTTPDVSYRTGGEPVTGCKENPTICNFRAGMERKEGAGASFVYDNGSFGVGLAYHFARLAHSHNKPNYEADQVRDMRYRTYNNDVVLSVKAQQKNIYYSAGVSYENVKGTWNGESPIGEMVSRHDRLGFVAGVSVDLRKDGKGFVPSLEYNLSSTKEKAGLTMNDTHNVEAIYINDNYTFPNLDIGNSLSEKRASPNTNKIVGSLDYFINKNGKFYIAYAYDLRGKSIRNNSTKEKFREYQLSLGFRLTI